MTSSEEFGIRGYLSNYDARVDAIDWAGRFLTVYYICKFTYDVIRDYMLKDGYSTEPPGVGCNYDLINGRVYWC